MHRLASTLILFFLFPLAAQASVLINEVAWMGTADSANDEWVELYNSGTTAVDVGGWTLTDGMNLSIILEGSIAAGDYAVLERTDDSSAPGSAFMIYTGALTNTGATLTLKKSDGSVHDVVAGGEDWESIGGDNTTKETAQLTTNGWITALATPGAQNATIDSREDDADEEVDDEEDVDTGRSTPVKSVTRDKSERVLTLPGSLLSLKIDLPDVVYVNQAIELEAQPSGLGPALTESLAYRWNFGDLSTGTGKTTTHTYDYPGEYVVTVWAGYARQEQIARRTVKVLPVKFSLTKNLSGDIQIHNDSPYEVDVSGYSLVGGSADVTFPALSFIPERGTVTIPKEKLGHINYGTQVQLHDQTKNLLAGYAPAQLAAAIDPAPLLTESRAVPAIEISAAPVAALSPSDDRFTFHTLIGEEALAATRTEMKIDENIEPSVSIGDAEEELPEGAKDWSLLGLAAVVLLGVFGTYVGAQKSDQ